jgi:hypothetical protein
MAEKEQGIKTSKLDCCPELGKKPVCDTLDLRYLLPYWTFSPDKKRRIKVELVLHFQLKRCSGDLILGDPIYSTTLLPGEKVRLYTSDRHSRWSYDSESQLSYRHETTSEESFLTAGMARAVSDLTVNESGVSSSSFEESWSEGGAGADVNILGIIKVGGGGSGGSYDAESTMAFSRNLSRHAEASSAYVAASVRAKSSTAVGEVERRSHAEGESEAHYEASTRIFQNPNQCHAVTYIFYKINKVQHISFKLKAITRSVEDPAAPVGAYQRTQEDIKGSLKIIPRAIPADHKDRLEVEKTARLSAMEYRNLAKVQETKLMSEDYAFRSMPAARTTVMMQEPLDLKLRQAIMSQVDKELVEAGLTDPGGELSKKVIAEMSWEREEIIPTPGILVRGCLDECDTCEPGLKEKIKLSLERKKLENELLKKQIDLLEQSQEYRCCPVDQEESNEE